MQKLAVRIMTLNHRVPTIQYINNSTMPYVALKIYLIQYVGLIM